MAKTKAGKVKNAYERNASFFWGIVVLAVIFFAFFYIFRFWGTVTYHGLVFSKERYSDFNNLVVYHYSHYFSYDGKQVYKSNTYLRGDPRENMIPVEGDVLFPKQGHAYVSADNKAFAECEDAQLAFGQVGAFLGAHLIQMRTGTPNPVANTSETNITQVTCETKPKDTVILFRSGDVTSIKQTGMCTEITVANCEVLPAAEKYIIEALIDARDAKHK